MKGNKHSAQPRPPRYGRRLRLADAAATGYQSRPAAVGACRFNENEHAKVATAVHGRFPPEHRGRAEAIFVVLAAGRAVGAAQAA